MGSTGRGTRVTDLLCIVELNAPYDHVGAAARITTWAIVHFLSEIFEQPR
jgi:hypothetical protein